MVQQFRFRQPQYTGEDRCLPCTTINLIMAVLIAGGVALINPFIGIGVLVVETVLIYYRGYLIPGTPELTKRYMPAWALKLFGKTPVEEQAQSASSAQEQSTDASELNPIDVLTAIGVATETEDQADITLTTTFENLLNQQDFADPTADAEAIFTKFFGDVTIEDTDTSVHLTRSDQGIIMNWPSHAAMIGDARIAQALAETDTQFTKRDEINQLQLIQSARTLLENCPVCDGSLSFSQEERETCCQTYTATVLSCDACDSTLLEINESTITDAATA